MAEATCELCGETYYVRPSKRDRSRFCSEACAIEARKNRVTLTCAHCGDDYEVKASNADESRFCSRECKDTHKRTSEEWGVRVDCANCGAVTRRPFSVREHERHFCDSGCWGAYLSETSVDGIAPDGSDHPNWKGGTSPDYGEGWYRKRRQVRERDEVCQACGEDGSDARLHVHHIVPRREFDDVDRSNAMINLVSLCARCHKLVENGSEPCPHPHVTDRSLVNRISAIQAFYSQKMGLDGLEPSPSSL